jgi:uncharacterized protein YkwD
MDSVEEAFLNSPHHRENIETARFNIIGLGAMAGNSGEMYFTQNFADWRPRQVVNAAAAPAPAQPAQPKARVRRPAAAKPAVAAKAAAAPTPEPTPVITAAPTPQPTPVTLAKQQAESVNLVDGLIAMLARFLAKVAGLWPA